ncbi:hypothetical protein HMI55_007054 [Coelomomyces lativittatus]|nr:hypothetical protein HMI55_007054 [Coelomomyces lativittatus]
MKLSVSSFSPFQRSNVYINALQWPVCAVESYAFPKKPYLILKLLEAFYCTAIVGVSLYSFLTNLDGKAWPSYFFYLTHLSFFSVVVYFWMSIYISFQYIYRSYASKSSAWFMTVYATLYSWNCALQPFIVIVYWCFLSGQLFPQLSSLSKFSSISEHGIGAFFMFLDVGFGTMVMPFWTLLPFTFIILLYLAYSFLHYGIYATWLYSILDLTQPRAAFMYPGMTIGILGMFIIMYFVHRLRDYLRSMLSFQRNTISSFVKKTSTESCLVVNEQV